MEMSAERPGRLVLIRFDLLQRRKDALLCLF
jgi:hypothetical protein